MTLFGIGPKLLASTLAYAVVPAVLTMAYPGFFVIHAVPTGVFNFAGAILLLIGIPLWLSSLFRLLKGFTQGKLCTTGVYSLVRNPLYSSYIVFIIPALIFFSRSWIMLTVPAFMVLIFRRLIKAEELFLEEQFGQQYREYKARVNALIPSFKVFTWK